MTGGTYYVSGALTGATLGFFIATADIVGNVLFGSDKLEIELTAKDLLSTALDAPLDFGLYPLPARHPPTVSTNASRSVAEVQA